MHAAECPGERRAAGIKIDRRYRREVVLEVLQRDTHGAGRAVVAIDAEEIALPGDCLPMNEAIAAERRGHSRERVKRPADIDRGVSLDRAAFSVEEHAPGCRRRDVPPQRTL